MIYKYIITVVILISYDLLLYLSKRNIWYHSTKNILTDIFVQKLKN